MSDTFSMKNARFYEEIDSTNRVARALARDGAPEGTVVYAARQSAGRGRLGKRFHSPQGGLYMSVVLRPVLHSEELMALTACVSVAVHRALRDSGILSQIKWVNDLFLNGRKICGILCEGQFSCETPDFIIAGIGLNLLPDATLPAELQPIVTDLYSETGCQFSPEQMGEQILLHLKLLLQELPGRTFLQEYRDFSLTLGRNVHISQGEREFSALAVDYDRNAALLIRHTDGTEELLQSGTATPM